MQKRGTFLIFAAAFARGQPLGYGTRVKPEFGAQQRDYAQISGTELCCSGSSPSKIETLKRFQQPRDCEPLCNDRPSCAFFSHSNTYSNCVLCNACALTRAKSGAEYTSWEKGVTSPPPLPPRASPQPHTAPPALKSPPSILVPPPTPLLSPYAQLSDTELCCSGNSPSKIETLKSFRQPMDCEPLCNDRPTCAFFSHSNKYSNCVLCNACALAPAKSGVKYTSWKKSSSLMPPLPPTPSPTPVQFKLSAFAKKSTWTPSGVSDNLSGGSVFKEVGPGGEHYLVVVINKPEELREYKITSDGKRTLLQIITLNGFDDTEGVAVMRGRQVAITEERRGTVVVVTLPDRPSGREMGRRVSVSKSHGKTYRTGVSNGNSGIEGVAFNSRENCLYALAEKGPRQVLRIDLSTSAVTPQFDVSRKIPERFASDLAGMEYVAELDHLMIISHQSSKLIQTTLQGDIVGTKNVGGTQPEGITFYPDLQTFLVISEPNEVLFYKRA